MWIVITFVGLLAAVIIIWLLRARFQGEPLLLATVSTPDDKNYYVQFQHLHPDMQPIEYVWLNLFLTAKLLYNIGNDRRQAAQAGQI